MLQLFASKITNLTDARYFAAFMPTYMSMPVTDPSETGIKNLQEIMSWVEGVKWLLEVHDFVEPSSVISQLPFAGVVYFDHENSLQFELPDPSFRKFIFLENEQTDLPPALLNHLCSEYDEIILAHSVSNILPGTIAKQCSKPLWLKVDTVEQWRHFEPVQEFLKGIMVAGSTEEKVGYKSFDNMDNLLEEVIYP